MTDREHIEMAAKAAGVAHEGIDDHGALLPFDNDGRFVGYWNPLEDDGDALRLAVQIDMQVFVGEAYIYCKSSASYWPGAHVDEDECPDKYAATRRAIVMAAAEIGRKMP